jgi:hypothetical protein
MDHFVKLDRFPEGVEFPPHMKDRFHFDAEAHRLVFRGYMSKADFDQISQLTSDWKFRRALEDLFRLCTPEPEPAASGFRRILATLSQLFSQ